MFTIEIDKSRLGNIDYGNSLVRNLSKIYVGATITKIEYDYFVEDFRITLDNGKTLWLLGE